MGRVLTIAAVLTTVALFTGWAVTALLASYDAPQPGER